MGLRAFFAKGLSKVKKNLADLIATGLFAASSVLMAASNPAVTIAITACSIATSIYFDCTHTRDKRRLFDELKARISLGKEIAEPSRTMEMVRYGGTLISLVCLGVYILLSSSGATIASGILEVSTGLAVLTCHVGRKIYDSQLGSSVHKMQEEINRMLEILEVKNTDEAQKYLKKVEDLTEINGIHRRLIGKIEHFLQGGERESIEEMQEFLKELVTESNSAPAESLDSSAKTLDRLGHDEVERAQIEVVACERSGDDERGNAAMPVSSPAL